MQRIQSRIAAHLPNLPGQLRHAAQWIVDNPRDVALLSMREQARRAGVQPASMTRLAQALGYEGFDELRAQHADILRGMGQGLSGQAQKRLKLDVSTPAGMADAMIAHAAAQIADLANSDLLHALEHAAAQLSQSARIFCLGQRSSHAVAWHFYYALSLVSDRSVLLDMTGGTGFDPLMRAGAGDALFVCCVQPYTRAVVDATEQARQRGLRIVAVTDSPFSPLVGPDDTALVVPTASASFLHAMTPAFLMADILAALVARADDPATLARLDGLDRQLATLNTFFQFPDDKAEP
ncbi:MurR/RpiR family transcriptional regulator [Roseinatronobacter alkalisoli]|uniref:MurR/RpiR family transcriptional regulator n=1 Tax=Roseinatronobacter alkalisoli TaxID=3028235 RepID=A0ABT5T5P5_9RHOB|nr:MurR/RpiR family transcriptional regulator [Roseinatronobacter sp. HJB301]MDD7970294.1 MurR/RpiR family transcriptional regulator [Roseinatronobacter sp. HJB301]